jgi:hypothetical protein
MKEQIKNICDIFDVNKLKKNSNCPDENVFAAYLEKSLQGKEKEQVKNHLLKCDYCLDMVADYVKDVYHVQVAEKEESSLHEKKICHG